MKKIIIANWKSNKNTKEAKSWLEVYAQGIKTEQEVVVAPAFTLLHEVAEAVAELSIPIKIGIQSLSSFPAGSYTGAVSIKNLEQLPIGYAIVGHSERRRYFHETNNDVAKQVEQAVLAGITPIVCVDREYISSQAAAISDDIRTKCVVAYEPVEAIGSGHSQDVGTVKQVVVEVQRHFGNVPVIYGGSVNEETSAEYCLVADGVLVGTASLDAQQFIKLVSKLD